MPSKSPAFQFYPRDYLSSMRVKLMTLEEKGAYTDLLCYCWLNGSIPRNPELCSRLVGNGCSISVATNVQRMFDGKSTDDSALVHERLDEEREKQESRRQGAKKAGLASAASRGFQKTNGSSTEGQRESNDRSISVATDFNPASASADANAAASSPAISCSQKAAPSFSPRKKFSEDDLATAKWIFGLILKLNPGQKESNFDKWAGTIRLMRESDGRTDKQIREVFSWANADSFWLKQIHSPDNLRKHYDKLNIQRNNPGTGNHRDNSAISGAVYAGDEAAGDRKPF